MLKRILELKRPLTRKNTLARTVVKPDGTVNVMTRTGQSGDVFFCMFTDSPKWFAQNLRTGKTANDLSQAVARAAVA